MCAIHFVFKSPLRNMYFNSYYFILSFVTCCHHNFIRQNKFHVKYIIMFQYIIYFNNFCMHIFLSHINDMLVICMSTNKSTPATGTTMAFVLGLLERLVIIDLIIHLILSTPISCQQPMHYSLSQ